MKALSLAKKWLVEPRPHLFSKVTAEFIACMMFHFIGSVSATAFTNGIALMVLVYYTAKTSGAHLNPALSLTFMLLGHTNPLELLCYWIAQIAGCICGALWIAALVPELEIGSSISRIGSGPFYDGCFIPADGVDNARIFGWEAVCTFCFIVPIFSVVWYTIHKKGYGNTGPLMVGLSLMANAFVAGPFTGAALNPARVLGSAAVFNCNNNHYIFYYIIGQVLAGLMVPFAIMPWYGIYPEAWYMKWLPIFVQKYVKTYEPTLTFNDVATMDSNEIAQKVLTKRFTKTGRYTFDSSEGDKIPPPPSIKIEQTQSLDKIDEVIAV